MRCEVLSHLNMGEIEVLIDAKFQIYDTKLTRIYGKTKLLVTSLSHAPHIRLSTLYPTFQTQTKSAFCILNQHLNWSRKKSIKNVDQHRRCMKLISRAIQEEEPFGIDSRRFVTMHNKTGFFSNATSSPDH